VPELETAIYRVVQEALTNVVRHAEARKACVSLLWEETRLVAKVQDDGKGVPEGIVRFRPGSVGVGVSGMRQRVKEFNGELRVANVYPGTLVEVVIPKPARAEKEKEASAAAMPGD
jgi:signal transduction histidine kinase